MSDQSPASTDSDAGASKPADAHQAAPTVAEASGEALSEEAAPVRKKHRRVVRQGGEKVVESEAVKSYRLADTTPRSAPQALGGNDAELLANVPPHWGKR